MIRLQIKPLSFILALTGNFKNSSLKTFCFGLPALSLLGLRPIKADWIGWSTRKLICWRSFRLQATQWQSGLSLRRRGCYLRHHSHPRTSGWVLQSAGACRHSPLSIPPCGTRFVRCKSVASTPSPPLFGTPHDTLMSCAILTSASMPLMHWLASVP